jgi:hypothetical protein
VIVSAVSGFMLSLATAGWVYVKIGWVGLIFVPLLLSLAGIGEVSRLQTPDALSAVVVFVAGVLFLSSSWRMSLWLLVGALLIRPDTILFLFLLIAFRFFFYERSPYNVMFLAVVGTTAIVLYSTVNHLAGHYGWGITLKHTVSPSPYPAREMTTIASFAEYLGILTFATKLQFFSRPIDIKTLYALIVGILSYFFFRQEKLCRNFSLLCVTYIVLHYLIFPAFFTRFFVAQNLLIYVSGMHSLRRYLLASDRGPETSA